MRLIPRACSLLCCGLLASFMTGCVVTAAYVNIPSQAGDVARESPNAANVLNAEIIALTALLNERGYAGTVYLQLPEGTSAEGYQKVQDGIGLANVITPYTQAETPPEDTVENQATETAEAESASDEDAMAETGPAPVGPPADSTVVQVTSIRLRGTSGAIDTVSPGRGGVPQLATVDLGYYALDGWRTERVRYSSAPVTDTILYVPTVKQAPEAPEATEPQEAPEAPEQEEAEQALEEAESQTPTAA